MLTPLHRSLLSREPTCHLRSESSFSTGDLQYPLAGQHLLSPRVKIPQFRQEVPPSAEMCISPKLLSLPICHSMQHTPCTPPTTPTPTTPTTPQRTPSPALPRKSSTPPPVQTPFRSRHEYRWRSNTLWDRYIRTQGLTIPDPLYKSTGIPRRTRSTNSSAQ